MSQLASRLWVACLVLVALPAAATIEPRGREVRLNANPGSRQVLPAVATSTAGPAVVWEHQQVGIKGLFLAPGTVSGTEVTLVANHGVPSIPFTGQIVVRREPAAAFGADGALVVVWTEERAAISTQPFFERREVIDQDVLAQRFDRDGRPLGRRFRVNAAARGNQRSPRLVAHATGFVAVWEDDRGLFARALDRAGRPVGTETRVSAGPARRPELAANAEGRVLVVWDGDDADAIGVHARLLDADARPLGAAFGVNTTVQHKQARPTVAAAADGGFLVAWQSEHPEHWSGFYSLYGQAVAGDGSPIGPEIRLYDGPLAEGSPQIAPSLAAAPAGHFLLTWITWKSTFGPDIAAVELDGLGVPVGTAFWVTERRVKTTFRELGVVADGAGGFLVVWESSARRATIAARSLVTR
jgi:large repetitive protein